MGLLFLHSLTKKVRLLGGRASVFLKIGIISTPIMVLNCLHFPPAFFFHVIYDLAGILILIIPGKQRVSSQGRKFFICRMIHVSFRRISKYSSYEKISALPDFAEYFRISLLQSMAI